MRKEEKKVEVEKDEEDEEEKEIIGRGKRGKGKKAALVKWIMEKENLQEYHKPVISKLVEMLLSPKSGNLKVICWRYYLGLVEDGRTLKGSKHGAAFRGSNGDESRADDGTPQELQKVLKKLI